MFMRILLVALLLFCFASVAMPLQATSWYCNGLFIKLSPTLQKICLAEFMMDHWDPLDWGD